MEIEFAPVQGHTDLAYRDIHAQTYGPADRYYTPFIRWEKDGIRPRDLRDAADALTDSAPDVTAQIIFRDSAELTKLVSTMRKAGHRRLDLNLGCPFPLQTAKGRGSAMIANTEMVRFLVQTTLDNPDIEFSLKMRLGFKDPHEWREALSILNNARLSHIALHPRVAAQQYGGVTDMCRFGEFLEASKHPVLYNGDILSPSLTVADSAEDSEVPTTLAKALEFKDHHNFAGIMIGRGLLGRPSLAAELSQGSEWPKERRLGEMLKFHRQMLEHYRETLYGDTQILDKIKPFWTYAESEIGRKAWKAIKKASNMAKYQTAVASIMD